MNEKAIRTILAACLCLGMTINVLADRQDEIYRIGRSLEEAAVRLAQDSFDHFKGWSGEISDQEQAVLFKTEAFAASCRLFLKLTEKRTAYFSSDNLRTNVYTTFSYLLDSFRELERELRRGDIRPYALNDCRRFLERMEDEFSHWPMADNLAYLDRKYVKARDETVYVIERRRAGLYIRRAFKNLESLYRYNYDLDRGENPWDNLVEVSVETLEKMDEGRMIDLTFEGYLLIEQSNRPNRPVYLIEGGKKRGLTSPQVLQRYGGWGKVLEVPVEVIRRYPDGEPIR